MLSFLHSYLIINQLSSFPIETLNKWEKLKFNLLTSFNPNTFLGARCPPVIDSHDIHGPPFFRIGHWEHLDDAVRGGVEPSNVALDVLQRVVGAPVHAAHCWEEKILVPLLCSGKPQSVSGSKQNYNCLQKNKTLLQYWRIIIALASI